VLQLVVINNAHVVIIIATINDNYYVFNKSLPSYVSGEVALPAFSAARRAVATCCCGAGRATIDRYLLPAGLTAANPPHAAAAGEWNRQIDRHTDEHHTMRAVSIKQKFNSIKY